MHGANRVGDEIGINSCEQKHVCPSNLVRFGEMPFSHFWIRIIIGSDRRPSKELKEKLIGSDWEGLGIIDRRSEPDR